jgi:hypothetical protein
VYATDLVPGDLFRRRGGPERRLVDRNHTSGLYSSFSVWFEGGEREPIGKLTRVEIHDPHGDVARRILGISAAAMFRQDRAN